MKNGQTTSLWRCILGKLFLISCLTAPAWSQESSFFPDLTKPMEFRYAYSGGNCASCVWISAQGEITLDTPRQFKGFWEEIKDGFEGTSIHLNSRGGDLGAALALGRMFREIGLATVVAETAGFDSSTGLRDGFLDTDDAVCESACVFAFIGGVNRAASERTSGEETGYQKIGKLKVHQFSSKSDGKVFTSEERVQDQIRTAVLLEYVVDMGVSADLLGLALTIPPDRQLYTLTEEDIQRLRIDTYLSDIQPRLRGYENGVGVVEIEKKTRRGTYLFEFFCDKNQKLLMKLTLVEWELDFDRPFDLAAEANTTGGPVTFLQKLQIEDFEPPTLRSYQKIGEYGSSERRIEAMYAFEETSVASLSKKTQFIFFVDHSSYLLWLGADLSFRLDREYDGFHLLPRLCLR